MRPATGSGSVASTCPSRTSVKPPLHALKLLHGNMHVAVAAAYHNQIVRVVSHGGGDSAVPQAIAGHRPPPTQPVA